MKKIFLLITIAFVIGAKAQENNTFRLGIQMGSQGNRSKFVGGMENANARFHQSPFGAAGLNIAARYDFNNHWAILSGMGLTSIGFQFGIAENYSFTQRTKRFTMLKSGFGAIEIPVLGAYKFNPNCKGWRWIVSGGVANIYTSAQSKSTNEGNSNDGTPAPGNSYLSSSQYTNAGSHWQGRIMIGREKLFQRGSILNVNFVMNAGFAEIAHATVNYNIDGQNYTHEFSNKGNFVGFRIAYYFKPFSGASKKSSSKVTGK